MAFTSWDDVERALAQDDWDWVVVARGGGAISLYTPGAGFLGVHDAELAQEERAELCRWGFSPMHLPPEGRFWLWRPPHAGRLTRGTALAWGIAKERDHQVLRVLRDLLDATPQDLVLQGRSIAG